MKRVLIRHSSPSLQKFFLRENDSNKVSFKYNHLQQSIRIGTESNKRLFFFEKKGFWQNRTTLKNEYGVETGSIVFEKGFNAGVIELDGNRHHFLIHNNPTAELVIYHKDMQEPLVACDLSTEQHAVTMHHYNSEDYEQACLLLGLCWFLLPHKETEQVAAPYYSRTSAA